MATAANYPLTVRIGDTCSIPVTVQDSAGAPINLSGRTYAAQIRATADASSVLASFTCTLVSSGTTGQFVCTIPATTTATLAAGAGVWDLQETNGSVVTTLLAGTVQIVQDVTR